MVITSTMMLDAGWLMTMKRARGGGEAESASAAGQGRSDGGRAGGRRKAWSNKG
jgi:hypothetical protein